MKGDNLGDRMKSYENVSRIYLEKKMPVIVRIDGKAFHTFTRNFKKPFDEVMVKTMQDTMKYLCENVEGCVLGYTQSDEITLVLCDYKKDTSQAWFDNNMQKICSVSASMATLAFNRYFDICLQNLNDDDKNDVTTVCIYNKAKEIGAMFDSRAFNIPIEEVNNCLLWRQLDAIRNSIQSVAQANFSHKQLQGKNCNELQIMLQREKNINWNEYPTHLKQGSCCVKIKQSILASNGEEVTRSRWIIDDKIPIFSKDKEYVNSKIVFD